MDAKLVNYDFKRNITKRCLVVISLFAALLSILTVVAISLGVAGLVHQHSVVSEIKELNAKLNRLASDTLKNVSQLMSHIDNLNISDLPDEITTLKDDIILMHNHVDFSRIKYQINQHNSKSTNLSTIYIVQID